MAGEVDCTHTSAVGFQISPKGSRTRRTDGPDPLVLQVTDILTVTCRPHPLSSQI
jgi:hypothetical protein